MSYWSNKRIEERNKALEVVSDLKRNINSVIVIHYSCQSFYQQAVLPRVTAICVKNKFNGSSSTFSISLQGQIRGMDVLNLTDDDFNSLEREMLDEFYAYVSAFRTHKWVHWNMRNATYGFDAIANRYRVLGGIPVNIEQQFRYDLNNLMYGLYTKKFEDNQPNGHLLNLAHSNSITRTNALTGAGEADAFDEQQYQALSMSTIRKVEIITQILEYTVNGELKVKTPDIEIYGLTLRGIAEIVKNSALLSTAYSLILFVGGVLVEDKIKALYCAIKCFFE